MNVKSVSCLCGWSLAECAWCLNTLKKFQHSERVSAELGGGCHGDKGVLVLRNWLILTEIVRISERECEKEDSE